MNVSYKIKCKRLLSGLLAFTLGIANLPLNMVNVRAAQLESFDVSIEWVNSGASDNVISWNANSRETKVVTMQINYQNNSNSTSNKTYPVDSIVIEVPGIGDSNRSSNIEANAIVDSDYTDKTWNYTWDSENDVYRFTNAKEISGYTNFAGMFQISWIMESRSLVDGYNKEIEAKLSVGDKYIKTNTLRFNFNSEGDEYDLKAQAIKLSDTDGLGSNANNYYWVKWGITNYTQLKSRDTYDKYYSVELENDEVMILPSIGILEPIDDNRYQFPYNGNTEVIIGYPKDKFIETDANHDFELYGKYLDRIETELLTNTHVNIHPSDYEFKYSGNSHYLEKVGTKDIKLDKDSLYDGLVLEYMLKGYIRYNGNSNRKIRKQRRVATSSNAEQLDENDFISPNYLDSLSLEELLDEDYFDEVIKEAKDLYNESKDEYLKEQEYLERLEEEEEGFEKYEDSEELENDLKNDEVNEIETDDKEKESEVNEIETDSNKDSEDLSDIEKESESCETEDKIPLKEDNSIESESSGEIIDSTELDEDSNKDSEDLSNEDEILKEQKIHLDDIPKLSISKKEVEIVQSSLENDEAHGLPKLDESLSDEDKMTVYLIDDFVEIHNTEGQFEELDDDEYEINSIIIPNNRVFVNANGFYIEPNKYIVEVYDLEGSLDEPIAKQFIDNNAHKIRLKSGVNKIAIRIPDLEESIYFIPNGIKLEMEFHLNREKATLKGGILRNLSGMVRCKNGEIDKSLFDDSYLGTDSERVINRDKDRYGFGMFRSVYDYTYESNIVHNDINLITSDLHRDNDGYAFNLEFKSDFSNSTNLDGWDVYSLLPEGITIDKDKFDEYKNNVEIHNIRNSEKLISYPDNFEVEYIEDYKGSGRTLIKARYDYSNNKINIDTSGGSGNFEVPLKIGYEYVEEFGMSYNINVVQILTDINKDSANWVNDNNGFDDGNLFNEDNDYWKDINENEIEEKLVFNSTSLSITEVTSTQMELKKYVATPYTFDKYTINQEYDSDILAYFGKMYSYRLKILNTGAAAKNVIIQDNLENNTKSEWTGALLEVDTSRLDELGLNYKIWYSNSTERFNRDDTSNWSEEPFKVLSDIKSVAIDFGEEQKLKPGKDIYVDLIMIGPEENERFIGKKAFNSFSVQFQQLDTIKELESNEVNTVLDNPKGTIKITKLDKVDDTELSDWEFELIDNNNKKVATITEKGMVPSIVDSGIYILRETRAPVGYEKVIDRTVEVTMEGLDLIIEEPRRTGSVTLHKKDDSSGNNLRGAKFDLYKGKQIIKSDLETDNNGEIHVDNLEWGEYYFEETLAPSGHYLYGNNKTRFNIDKNNLVIDIDIKNRSLGTVELTKYDKDQKGLTVSGAEYELYNSYGKSIGLYRTNEFGKIRVRDLEWGSYYFLEYMAPNGYEINDRKIEFEVTRANSIALIKVETEDEEKKSSITITKINEDGEKLRDAQFRLTRIEDNKEINIGNYKTDISGTVNIEGLKFGTYKIKEIKAPKGYELSSQEEIFVIDETTNGGHLEFKFINIKKKGYIEITKKDDFGYSVEGAVFNLYKDDKIVESGLVTNEFGIIQIGSLDNPKLEWGEYILKETKAPKGYKLDEKEYKFEINSTNVENLIKIDLINIRENGSVKLKKYLKDSDITLSDATYTLYNENGVYITKGITDENGEILFENIPWGSYYLEETEAPSGYAISEEKIRFIVTRENSGVVQEFRADDELEKTSLKITKQLKNNDIDIYEPFGNPSFLYKIEGKDKSGENHVWYRQITLSKEKTEETVTLSNIPVSDENGYKITELNAVKYKLVDINGDRHISVKNIDEGSAIADLSENNKDNKAAVTFTNELMRYDKYTSTNSVMNLIKKSRKLVYLEVEYNGLSDITELFNKDGTFDLRNNNFLNDNLVVTAFYDSKDSNGNVSKVLNYGEYQIQPKILLGQGGQYFYNIKVNYEENGIVKYGSFNVSASVRKSLAKVSYKNMTGLDDTVQEMTLEYGKSIKLPNLVNTIEGYKCDGYKISANEYEYIYNFGDELTINSDYIECNGIKQYFGDVITEVIIEPNWKLEEYKVYLDCDYRLASGDWRRETIELFTYTINDEKTYTELENFKTVGYTYNGLIDSGTNNNIGKKIILLRGSTGDRTYKLDLEKINYTLRFMIGGEGGVILNEMEGGKLEYTYNIESDDIILPQVERPGFKLISLTPSINTKEKYKPYEHLKNETYKYEWEEMISEVTGRQFNEAVKLAASKDINKIGILDSNDKVIGFKVDKGVKIPEGSIILNKGALYETGAYFDETSGYVHIVSEANKIKFTNLAYMFICLTKLTDISEFNKFDFSDTLDLADFFYECKSIEDINVLSVLNGKKLKGAMNMFFNCNKLSDITPIKDWDVSEMTNFNNLLESTSVSDLSPLSNWDTSSATEMFQTFSDSKITDTSAIKNWDTSKVTKMENIFYSCNQLKDISDLSEWDVSNVKNMRQMFAGCQQLTDVNVLSNWNTQNLTNIESIFRDCKNLTSLDGLEKWDTSNVSNMKQAFEGCTALSNTNALSEWDISNVIDLSNIFNDCKNLNSLDGLKNWDTSNVTTMKNVFNGCEKLNNISALSEWKTHNVTDLEATFNGCIRLTSLDGLEKWDVSKVSNMKNLFHKCTILNDISALSEWKTNNITNIEGLFNECQQITSITSLRDWDTSKVTTLQDTFRACENLTSLDGLEKWDTSSVTSLHATFYANKNIKNIEPLYNWNTSKVTTMYYTFMRAENLTTIDLEGQGVHGIHWDTSSVTNMSRTFEECRKLINIEGLQTFDTSSLSDCSNMFYMCTELMSVTPIKEWDMSKVKNMSRMFASCNHINNIIEIKDWDVSNVDKAGFENLCHHTGSLTGQNYEDTITTWTFTKRPGKWISTDINKNTYIPNE